MKAEGCGVVSVSILMNAQNNKITPDYIYDTYNLRVENISLRRYL